RVQQLRAFYVEQLDREADGALVVGTPEWIRGKSHPGRVTGASKQTDAQGRIQVRDDLETTVRNPVSPYEDGAPGRGLSSPDAVGGGDGHPTDVGAVGEAVAVDERRIDLQRVWVGAVVVDEHQVPHPERQMEVVEGPAPAVPAPPPAEVVGVADVPDLELGEV